MERFVKAGVALLPVSDDNWELIGPALKAEHRQEIRRESVFEAESSMLEFVTAFGRFSDEKLSVAGRFPYSRWSGFGVVDTGNKRIVHVF